MRSLKMKIQLQAEMALQRKKSIRQSAGESTGPTSRGCLGGGSAADSGQESGDRDSFANHVDVHVAIDAELNVQSKSNDANSAHNRNSLGSVITKHRTNKSDATTTLQGGIYGSDVSCAQPGGDKIFRGPTNTSQRVYLSATLQKHEESKFSSSLGSPANKSMQPAGDQHSAIIEELDQTLSRGTPPVEDCVVSTFSAQKNLKLFSNAVQGNSHTPAGAIGLNSNIIPTAEGGTIPRMNVNVNE